MGILYDPLDLALASAAKVRLLRALAPLGRPVSGRQAARLARVSPKTAWRALEELWALGLVRRQEAGGQHLYTANRENILWEGVERLFALEEQRISTVFGHLRRALAKVDGSPVLSGAIFGSAARGKAGPDSDLDVLVLTTDETSADAVRSSLAEEGPVFSERFGLPLSPVVMTLERFRERQRAGDPFCREVVRDAIVIVGQHPGELSDGKRRPA